jgi:hypothetical protein
VEYSASKKVCLQPDIVEYGPGDQAPMYDLIMSKQTMQDLGVKLDFQEKTITIDEILLHMRNIVKWQLKPRITRALRENTCFAQEPVLLPCCAIQAQQLHGKMIILRKNNYESVILQIGVPHLHVC